MRAILTRVTSASVTIEGQTVGQIGKGFLILLGVGPNDTEKECRYLAEKALGLRIFEDENGKMNKSLEDINGEILLISQFTLYAATRKGRRPSFDMAARPEHAEPLYEYFIQKLRSRGVKVETGIFGADMLIEIHNDGPVTMLVEYPEA